MKEYSPFTPGIPVPVEYFVGRDNELRGIIATTKKSISQNSLERIFVTGERGMGKSSLCKMATAISEAEDNVLGLHLHLGGVNTLEEMARMVFERLLRNSRDKNWFGTVKDFFGNHVKQVGLFGFMLEFTASPSDLRKSISEFPYILKNLLEKLKDEKKGIILILDDLNGLAGSADFANWLKSFVDEVATSNIHLPVLLILVGIPERRRQLINNQPSLDRVFNMIQVKRFENDETIKFFDQSFTKINVKVEKKAMELLCRYSGGHPVFMHEIGDAVFNIDEDDNIDHKDAMLGIVRSAEAIGAKYIEPKVLATVRSDRYRAILKKIVRAPDEHRFSKQDLSKRISPDESKVLHNFLQKMKNLGVISQPPEAPRGEYEFTSELYSLFFWLQATAQKSHDRNANTRGQPK
ncbi:MAG: AAA family ATPase [Verrucomicrobia bacterium]|nr:AAA family ATPase [Verrucomicrobiota bacterium]MCF7709082.1 AAA family ATPase [Verrucomicrobiota bacterium]